MRKAQIQERTGMLFGLPVLIKKQKLFRDADACVGILFFDT